MDPDQESDTNKWSSDNQDDSHIEEGSDIQLDEEEEDNATG